MVAKPCTARVTWGALAVALRLSARPDDMPSWHHCTLDRGHDGKHRAEWQGHVYEWEPMRGGAREGAGRRHKEPEERRTERVVVLARPDELRALEAAAEGPLGPWLLAAGLRAARRRK